jgi:hypothetical protein
MIINKFKKMNNIKTKNGGKWMTLLEALQACENGDFVSNQYFDSKQSMHEYNGELYYEDGANITNDIEWLEKQAFAQSEWYVKYPKCKIDMEKLTSMHEKHKGYMLQDSTYEECAIQ